MAESPHPPLDHDQQILALSLAWSEIVYVLFRSNPALENELRTRLRADRKILEESKLPDAVEHIDRLCIMSGLDLDREDDGAP